MRRSAGGGCERICPHLGWPGGRTPYRRRACYLQQRAQPVAVVQRRTVRAGKPGGCRSGARPCSRASGTRGRPHRAGRLVRRPRIGDPHRLRTGGSAVCYRQPADHGAFDCRPALGGTCRPPARLSNPHSSPPRHRRVGGDRVSGRAFHSHASCRNAQRGSCIKRSLRPLARHAKPEHAGREPARSTARGKGFGCCRNGRAHHACRAWVRAVEGGDG